MNTMLTFNELERLALNEFVAQHYAEWKAVADSFLTPEERAALEKKLESGNE
jgi:hypothetical protein